MTFGGGLEATAFTIAGVDRSSAIDVASDGEATLGINPAQNVHINSTETLVNTTNRLGRPVTVTVALRSESTSRGDLVVDGQNMGDQVSLSLARGETTDVQISIADNSSLAETSIHFDVRASASGINVAANNRSVPVKG